MMPTAVIRHPRRRHYHAGLACSQRTTRASDEVLTVCTESMARGEGRVPCPSCWSPEGYVVIPDRIPYLEHKAAHGYGV
jgi:hypothetical protein